MNRKWQSMILVVTLVATSLLGTSCRETEEAVPAPADAPPEAAAAVNAPAPAEPSPEAPAAKADRAPATVAEAKTPDIPDAPASPVASDTPAWLAEFFGGELVNAAGEKVPCSSLNGKTVGIYFSAHWCPPCRGFTPQLVTAYNEMKKAGKDFEVVFVSSDKNEEAMFGYMKEVTMPWVALPFDSDLKAPLAGRYSVRGIPTLVIVDDKGETITTNGRGDISAKGAAAFASWNS